MTLSLRVSYSGPKHFLSAANITQTCSCLLHIRNIYDYFEILKPAKRISLIRNFSRPRNKNKSLFHKVSSNISALFNNLTFYQIDGGSQY